MKLGAVAALALSAAVITSLASAAPVTAAQSPGASPAATASAPSPAALAMRATLARQHQAALRARRPGTVTGVIRSFTGQPLPGACVTAFGPAGTGTARAGSAGTFSVRGLAAGSYTLKYADCARPGEFLPQWSSAAPTAALARQITVRAGRPTAAGTVTLQPASPAALTRESAATLHVRAAALPGAAGLKLGGVSGRVTSRSGRPIRHTCAEVHSTDFYVGVPVSKTGRWTVGKSLPPGRYTVEFAALDCAGNPGNWAPQWYRNQSRAAKASRVRIRSGKITTGINGRLRHGGIISGIVTGRAGKRLAGACALLFTGPASFPVFRTTRGGRYSFRGLPAGHYRMLFQGNCTGRPTPYLWQWWRGARSYTGARAIRVRLRHTTGGISPRLVIGGKITGTVRFRTAAGRPLRGICVDASTGGPETGYDALAATGKNGRYVAEGLPPGRYRVEFSPGCSNNGDYLAASYPHRVRIAAGQTAGNISAVLKPGATVSGTVTDAHGKAVGGISVFVSDAQGNGNGTCTSPTGRYSVGQLPPGSYTVAFVNECGAKGNYAPQYYPGQPSAATARSLRLWLGRKVTGINAAMQPGATITGTLTSISGQPAGTVCVSIQQVSDAFFDAEFVADFAGYDARTSAAGRYRVRDLAAGRYAVQFFSCGGRQFASRWFGGRPGSGIGDIVTVAGGATVRGIGAVMSPGGTISGTVRTGAGKPLADACEIITSLRTGQVLFGDPGFTSRYRVAGLPPGRYTIEFYDCAGSNYAIQWYKNRPGPGSATAVRVTAGHTTGSIDVALPRGGRITGRLTAAATGQPVRGFCVDASTASGTFFGFGSTSRNGDYTLSGLNTGRYRLTVSNCNDNAGMIAAGSPAGTIRVVRPRTVTGVNIARPPGGSISGQVLSGSPATPPGDVCVDAVPAASSGVAATASVETTGSDGRYQLRNLPAGRYQVFFNTTGGCDNSQDGLVPQWYDSASSRAAATVITVAAGHASTGISATLRADGGISGTVTSGPDGPALSGACVRVVPRAAGRAASFTATSAGGGYRVSGLAPGRYTVRFSSGCGASGYATQWWRDAASAGAATVITVPSGAVTTGIDAALAK